MSMSIYAGKTAPEEFNGRIIEVCSPVFDFDTWEPFITDFSSDRDMRRLNPDHVEDAGVTLSNANARAVLLELGFPLEDESCRLDIGDFINACLRWTANAGIDGGIETSISREPGGPAMIDCGRRRGYLNDRIAELHRIAVKGRTAGATVIVAA